MTTSFFAKRVFLFVLMPHIASCASTAKIDPSYHDAIRNSIAHPTDISRSDASSILEDCLKSGIRGDHKNERKQLLYTTLAQATQEWPEYVFLERIGMTYLSHQYTFIGLRDISTRVIIKNWKYNTTPLDATFTNYRLRKVQTLFESFRHDVARPWLPVEPSQNQHPGCFFLTLRLKEARYQYAIFDPSFANVSSSPPIRILKSLSSLTNSAVFSGDGQSGP